MAKYTKAYKEALAVWAPLSLDDLFNAVAVYYCPDCDDIIPCDDYYQECPTCGCEDIVESQ